MSLPEDAAGQQRLRHVNALPWRALTVKAHQTKLPNRGSDRGMEGLNAHPNLRSYLSLGSLVEHSESPGPVSLSIPCSVLQ